MEDNLANRSRLRGLYSQRDNLTEKLDRLNKQKGEVDTEIAEVSGKLEGVYRGISRLDGRGILLTTHFIKRFKERVGEATEDEIRERVLTNQFVNMVRSLGNGQYPFEQYTIVVEDNKLLTITMPYTKKEKQRRFNQRPRR